MAMGVIFDLSRTVYDPETDDFTLGCEELLRALRARGYILCLLDRTGDGRVELVCRLKLYEFFKEVLLVEDKTLEHFKECLKGLGLPACEVAVVGDRLDKEIAIGNEIGMITIWYRAGEFARLLPKDESQIPDFITSDIRDVTKFAAGGIK